MKTQLKAVVVVTALSLALWGCSKKNGGTTTNGGGGNANANESGPRIFGGTTKPKKPKISKKAKQQLKKAKEDLNKTLKTAAARGGKWKQSECEKLAKAFSRIADKNKGESNAVSLAKFNEGVAWSKCDINDKAKEAWEAALSAKPNYPPAIVNLAELAARGKNPQTAYRQFLRAFNKQPSNLAANYNLAVLFEKQARTGAKAPSELRSFWKKARFKADNAFELASLHLRMVMAKASAGQTLAMSTLHLKAYNLLTLLYLKRSRWRRHRSKLFLAQLVLQEAGKLPKKVEKNGWQKKVCAKPSAPTGFDRAAAQMHNIHGLILLRQKRLVEATQKFDLALLCDGEFAEAHLNRAAISLGFRGYWIAHKSFTAVLKQQPKNIDAVIGLGVAARGISSLPPNARQGKQPSAWFKMAEDQYNKALAIDPDAKNAIFNLGNLYKDYIAQQATGGPCDVIGKVRKAKKYFQDFLKKRVTRKERAMAKEEIEEIDYDQTNQFALLRLQKKTCPGIPMPPAPPPRRRRRR